MKIIKVTLSMTDKTHQTILSQTETDNNVVDVLRTMFKEKGFDVEVNESKNIMDEIGNFFTPPEK